MRLDTRVLAAVVLVGATFFACTDDGTPCYPQDYRACDCPSAPHGFQQCTADGQGYGACDCSGKVPGVPGSGDASTDAAPDALAEAAPDAGALLPFMAACETNEQCDTGLCFDFNAKGPHCTRPCTQPSECPPPSSGCSNMGVCKAP